VGILIVIEGNMVRWQYVEILNGRVEESVGKMSLNMDPFDFLLGNNPKDTSNDVLKWSKMKCLNVLDCPSQLKALKLIQHLYNHARRQILKYPTPPPPSAPQGIFW
jgi:hypothetical protein